MEAGRRLFADQAAVSGSDTDCRKLRVGRLAAQNGGPSNSVAPESG